MCLKMVAETARASSRSQLKLATTGNYARLSAHCCPAPTRYSQSPRSGVNHGRGNPGRGQDAELIIATPSSTELRLRCSSSHKVVESSMRWTGLGGATRSTLHAKFKAAPASRLAIRSGGAHSHCRNDRDPYSLNKTKKNDRNAIDCPRLLNEHSDPGTHAPHLTRLLLPTPGPSSVPIGSIASSSRA